MLYITFENESGHLETVTAWVGTVVNLHFMKRETVSVQADGNELEAIYMRKLYPHTPPRALNGRMKVVRFFGDAAKFIVANW